MPPKAKVTKQDIILAAIRLVRSQGEQALNARALAVALGCSTQPIFSNYENMEQLRADMLEQTWKVYEEYIGKEMALKRYPDYKAYGMAYIRFAAEDPELFKLLFMRKRTSREAAEGDEDIADVVTVIRKTTGLSEEMAKLLHLEVWTFVHGLATLTVTSYLKLDWELISNMLTDVYQGLLIRFGVKG